MKIQIILCGLLLVNLSISSCMGLFSHPHQAELRRAYEYSRTIITKARRKLDTSRIPEAFTHNTIDSIEKDFAIERERAEENPTFIGEEVEVDRVYVEEYNPPEAIIKVKYFFRSYTYNRDTGEIIYHDKPRRFWRNIRVRMRQEDGVWKVDEVLEIVDWSG